MKLLNPLFDYLDSGKLFRQPMAVLYYILGIVLGIACLVPLAKFWEEAKWIEGMYYVYAVYLTLIFLALGVFTVLFWFRRAGELKQDAPVGARFVAIPVVTNFFKVIGEWLGFVIAIGCAAAGVGMILFASFEIGSTAVLSGLAAIVGGVIGGYLTIVFFRFMAELYFAIASIANDTRKIADK